VELLLKDQEKSLSAPAPSSQRLRRGSTEPLQNQIDGHCQGEITGSRPEEPRDTSQVETLDKGKEGAAAARQGAEGVGEELREQQQQEEDKEDVAGVVEGTKMQGQQRQQEGKDELAMEELQEGGRG
jgi:hypothetical protein